MVCVFGQASLFFGTRLLNTQQITSAVMNKEMKRITRITTPAITTYAEYVVMILTFSKTSFVGRLVLEVLVEFVMLLMASVCVVSGRVVLVTGWR